MLTWKTLHTELNRDPEQECTSVIQATWEAEAGDQPVQLSEILSQQ